MTMRKRTFAFGILAAMLYAGAAHAADAVVKIKTFMFMPMNLTITAGSTVTWTNLDEEPHTVTSVDGLFRSGGIDGGGTYRFQFVKPGVYKYSCSIHPQMVGTITVR
jgi:plastocyanin